MPETTSIVSLDATITISVIVALCAIISPVLTALINNCHHTKIRKLELQQQHYRDTVIHQRDIIENYFHAASQCFHTPIGETFSQYGNWHCIAVMYAPTELREQMIRINTLATDQKWKEATALLEDLANKMNILIQNM